MKTYYLLIILLMCSLISRAQFTKGNFLVGGSVSGMNTTSREHSPNINSNESKTTNFTAQLSGGYFVIDNLAVGALINWSKDHYNDAGQFESDTKHDYSAGLFARYYVQKFYATTSFSMGKTSEVYESDGIGHNLQRYNNLTFGIGYALMLNKYVALEPQINYAISKSSDRQDPASHSKVGMFTLGLGLQFYLLRK